MVRLSGNVGIFGGPGIVDSQAQVVLEIFLVLEIKHYIFDYVVQTPYQFMNKGTYGHPGGFVHAGLHALGTMAAFLIITPPLALGVAIVLGEFLIHYHVDWTKEQLLKYWRLTTKDGAYWRIYGADQLAHHLTYIAIAAILVWSQAASVAS
jgi:hypothetical protein